MIASELVGAVAAAILSEELAPDTGGSQGTGRYALNLGPEQTAAVAKTVLADPVLQERIELKLPADYLAGYALPNEALTSLPATYFRNADCSKAAFLLANVEHDEEASFNEIARLGPPELLERLDFWVCIASAGLTLPEEQLRWWEKALAGLRDLRLVSLDRFADYILRTRDAVEGDGLPLLRAMGFALPALRLPRDSSYFLGLKEKVRGHASAWRAQFANAQRRRGGLLLKQTASQLILGEDDLSSAFEKVREAIPEAHHPRVTAFIAAPSGWNSQAARLSECEWEEVKPLFDGLQREKFNLAQGTLDFYAEREPGLLSDDDQEYLKLLAGRRTSEATEDDAGFYEAHRGELKEDRKLKSAWDRFVFGRPIEATDFLAGLSAALEPLFNRAPSGVGRRLSIRCERATKRDLRELNVDAGLFFAHRYAGLERLLGDNVTWDVGDLFAFPELTVAWRSAGKGGLNRSVARSALQLRFVLELETDTEMGSTQSCSAQLVWRYEPNAVTSQLPEDWGRLAKHPFIACRASRDFGSKARAQTVNLADVRTLVPAYDRDRGSFVPAYKADRDIAIHWRRNLRACREDGYLSAAAAASLETSFSRFEDAYSHAIRNFPSHGAAAHANRIQATAFASLLEQVLTLAKGDRNRGLLLQPLLQIGVVPVDGGAPAAVVAPWHPLRLAALWRKARLVADLVQRLLTSRDAAAGDTRLFFRDLAADLAHPLYPEIVIAWTADEPRLLAVSDVVGDYTLNEPPVTTPDAGEDTNENPAEGSACVLDLVRRYLALNPHERANLSVVLFNCDSARLPQAVVERVASIQDDEDVRCQVLLRHVDRGRLRDLYRAILSAEVDTDAYSPSEATQDFMARLRISVVADQAPPPDPRDGCPYDIVFSQDVISRHARVEWYPEKADPADFTALMPSRWSRRRPAAADDLKSAAYLCCPVQPFEGWSYLSAMATTVRGDWDGDTGRRLLPVRQLDFRDPRTSRIFQETHDLGGWVVNFDDLLDRRQLLNQDVRVIRFKQASTQGRNLIISSRAPLSLLRSMILHRLRSLALDLSEADLRALADRLIDDANDVSGDIVLRAARRGQSASELIGVVLSRRLLRDELGDDRLAGWYFLDDYAAWVGQREEQLADLLAISPIVGPDGVLRASLLVAEAKYVELESLAAKRKESQKQLRDTLKRIEEAVFGEPERLDRQSWLSRLADLMLDGIRIPAASGIDLGEWRRAMREGRCEIELRGVSHVFVPTSAEEDPTEFSELLGAASAHQEVYGRGALKRLLMAYWHRRSTLDIRRELGEDHLDAAPSWRRPSPAEPEPELDVESHGPSTSATTTPEARLAERHGQASPPSFAGEPPAPLAGAQPSGWAYPAIDALLRVPEAAAPPTDGSAEWLSRVSSATKGALQQLQLQAKLLGASLTPNSALLRFAGSANLTVEQVNKRRSELLTTFGLNIISIRPEPGAVVLAVERDPRQTVSIEALWSSWTPQQNSWGNQELLIGVRERDGTHLILAPSSRHAPHTLIAGSTGSGKSVLVQNILLAIAATNSPDQARIVMIDPKQGVDYFAFEGLPHLEGGIIDGQGTAAQRLADIVQEMDRRYVLFRAARAPNLAAFNEKMRPEQRLPVIWLIHDEFAEWMMTDDYREAVSTIVQRLGVKARAAGIYLIFAAQRPDANVMPMQLRANLGNRLILRVDSEGTSEIALGERGAERLLGRGHLLAKLEGERDLVFAQVPFVSSAFLEHAMLAIRP